MICIFSGQRATFLVVMKGLTAFPCAPGPHCEGVGVNVGSQTGDIQPLQELSANPR